MIKSNMYYSYFFDLLSSSGERSIVGYIISTIFRVLQKSVLDCLAFVISSITIILVLVEIPNLLILLNIIFRDCAILVEK